MAPLYDPTSHPLLSTEAGALDPDELEAHAEIAESALGLADTEFEDSEATEATHAVVRQVNLQVDVGLTPKIAYLESERKGDEARTYRSASPEAGEGVLLDPLAKRMVANLKSRSGWGTLSGFR